jgi:hypothetical protein
LKTKKLKVPVTERALVARINRKLAHQGEKLLKSRSQLNHVSPGDYYIVNVERNYTAGVPYDVEPLAKELGVLKPWEKAE